HVHRRSGLRLFGFRFCFRIARQSERRDHQLGGEREACNSAREPPRTVSVFFAARNSWVVIHQREAPCLRYVIRCKTRVCTMVSRGAIQSSPKCSPLAIRAPLTNSFALTCLRPSILTYNTRRRLPAPQATRNSFSSQTKAPARSSVRPSSGGATCNWQFCF